MSITPTRPDEQQEEVSSETERKLRERDATFEQDYAWREDAERAMKEIRRSLPPLAPR